MATGTIIPLRSYMPVVDVNELAVSAVIGLEAMAVITEARCSFLQCIPDIRHKLHLCRYAGARLTRLVSKKYFLPLVTGSTICGKLNGPARGLAEKKKINKNQDR